MSLLKIPPEEVSDVHYEPPSLPTGGAYTEDGPDDEFDQTNNVEVKGSLEFEDQPDASNYDCECGYTYVHIV